MRNKFRWIILILFVVLFFPKKYQSFEGFPSAEAFRDGYAKEFCVGYGHELNSAERKMIPDAIGKALCFGWVIKYQTEGIFKN